MFAPMSISMYLKGSRDGGRENVAVMVAIGSDDKGYREAVGAAWASRIQGIWRDFFPRLRSFGLHESRMLVGVILYLWLNPSLKCSLKRLARAARFASAITPLLRFLDSNVRRSNDA